MVIRWVHVATLVVVTFTVTQCEQSISNQNVNNGNAEDLCPCLPVEICPRVFGAQPEDAKYFGDIKKCDDDNYVRCCGASASFVVGKGSSTITPTQRPILTTTKAPLSEILSRLNPGDDRENEIPNSENDSVIIKDKRTESTRPSDSANIDNFQQRKFMNGEIDEEPAESEYITETADTQSTHHQQQSTTATEPDSTQAVTTEEQHISHRQPKNLDNIMMVYPNFPKIMSGIPKTTPKNMPETNEMKMFDEEVGMDLHLVFSRTTLKPEITTENIEEVDSEAIISTTKQPHFRFAKRRKQYGPVQRRTTESPTEDMESIPTTVKIRATTRPTTKVKKFKRPSPQELTDSTTQSPRIKVTTRTPIIQDEEEEILHTSDDDKTQTNRFRLFSARHRLNYLRRSTTTTTETPLEVSTRHNSQSKTLDNRRPTKLNESSHPKVPQNVRPSKMNETLIRRMDTDHRNMISKVQVALQAATTENQIVEIPRSFASVEMNSRVKKIEETLANKMMMVFSETQKKRRGNRHETTSDPTIIVQKHKQISSTEGSISKPTSSTTRPYRGKKKFEFTDLLDKSVTIAMPNEVRRMRIRSTTVKPTVVTSETTTTRVQRRRPTTTIQPSVQDFDESKISGQETLSRNNQGRQYRRRTFIRRKYAVEPTLTTTITPPVRITSSETITTVEFTTNPTTSPTTTTVSTTTTPETTTPTPITTQSITTEVVEESEDTDNVEIEQIVTTTAHSIDSDVSMEFKPSPLWSIRSNEPTDFVELESLSHHGVADEKSNRRSRNTFEPPSQYSNGFIPFLPVNMNPFDSKIQIIGPIPKSNNFSNNKRVKYDLQKDKVSKVNQH